MADSWQTPAAIAVVALTIVAFVVRLVRRRSSQGKGKGGDCGGGCDCPTKPPRPPHR